MQGKRIRLVMLVAAAAVLVAACAPRRTVVVETRSDGIPVHATGRVDNGQYVVVRGDTLYSIAFRASVDYRDLARWNGISSPYVIHAGQRLKLQAPPRVASAPRPAPVSTPSRSPSPPVFQTVPDSNAPVPEPTPATAPAVTGVAVAGSATIAAPAPPAPVATVPKAATRSAAGITWRWPADGAILKGFKASDAIPGVEIAGNAGDPVRAAADGQVVYSGNGLVGYGELIIIKHNDSYLSAYGHNRKRLVKEGERVRAGQLIAEMGSSGASRNELQFQIRRDGKAIDPLGYLPKR